MPYSHEHALINRIIADRDMHTPLRLKISERYFSQPETVAIWKWLWRHYHSSVSKGTVPSQEALRQVFPVFPFQPVHDDIRSLCRWIREDRLRADLIPLLEKVRFEKDIDPELALRNLQLGVANLSMSTDITDDKELADMYDEFKQEYDLTASGQGITGIAWPWPILNADTQGLHKGSHNIIFAKPKSGKTWMGLYIGVHAYYHESCRVLIYSLEMKPKMVNRRCAAILAQVDYTDLINGRLPKEDYERFFHWLRTLKDNDANTVNSRGRNPALRVCAPGRDENSGGITSLRAKIREFEPDLVIVDGQYLMRDDRGGARSVDWKSQYNVSHDIKSLALEEDIPIIGITQAKRNTGKDTAKEVDLDDIGYAQAVGQDADNIMYVKRRKDDKGQWELVISFPGVRETQLEAFTINYSPARDFSFKSSTVAPDAPQHTTNSPNIGHRASQPGTQLPSYGR